MQVRIGGRKTYCLQKANIKFFDYMKLLVDILDDEFYNTILELLENDVDRREQFIEKVAELREDV